jgi:hypothetical protein
MVPSESSLQDLSNEWSRQYVSTILKHFWQFLCPTLGDRSHNQSLKLKEIKPKTHKMELVIHTNRFWYEVYFRQV